MHRTAHTTKTYLVQNTNNANVEKSWVSQALRNTGLAKGLRWFEEGEPSPLSGKSFPGREDSREEKSGVSDNVDICTFWIRGLMLPPRQSPKKANKETAKQRKIWAIAKGTSVCPAPQGVDPCGEFGSESRSQGLTQIST